MRLRLPSIPFSYDLAIYSRAETYLVGIKGLVCSRVDGKDHACVTVVGGNCLGAEKPERSSGIIDRDCPLSERGGGVGCCLEARVDTGLWCGHESAWVSESGLCDRLMHKINMPGIQISIERRTWFLERNSKETVSPCATVRL